SLPSLISSLFPYTTLFRSFLFCAAHIHGAFLFHPLVQDGFLELPAVSQFESGNLFLGYILIERVRTDPQVLRRLANIHYLTRIRSEEHTSELQSPCNLVCR